MATARRLYPDAFPNPRQIREALGISREKMARLMDVSAKTIERWEERNALPLGAASAGRLALIREIVDLGLVVYNSDGLRRFLSTPSGEFGGRTGLQLIEIGEGDKVLAALAADYEGLGH